MSDKIQKEMTADEEQQFYMDLQKEKAPRYRGANIATVAMFLSFIFVFTALFFIFPDKEMSEDENRALQTAPKVTLDAVTSGQFATDISNYVADQFPFRNAFIGIKAACEKILLKDQNNGVITAGDGYLVTRYDTVDEKILRGNLESIAAFKEHCDKNGIEVTSAFAGRTMDTVTDVIPSSYGTDASDAAWDLLKKDCAELGLDYIDLREPIKEAFSKGEYVMYKTDHHWTSLGAFRAYEAIAESASLPTFTKDDFTVETVSDSFFGTTWSTSGTKWTKPDTIELFRFDGDGDLTSTLSTGKVIEGLYDMNALDTKDKYKVFLDGNTAETDITLEGADRECVLVVKDSFAHSLVPFLARTYDVVMIDLRYYTGSPAELCREQNINKVFLIYNMDTLANESGFRLFKMGLDK